MSDILSVILQILPEKLIFFIIFGVCVCVCRTYGNFVMETELGLPGLVPSHLLSHLNSPYLSSSYRTSKLGNRKKVKRFCPSVLVTVQPL